MPSSGGGTGGGGLGTGFVPEPEAVLGDLPDGATPPASPLEVTAGFVPPTAGSGGLLGMPSDESGTSRTFGALLLVILLGMGLASNRFRRVC